MSHEHSSYAPIPPINDVSSLRPPEIDKFVDHFLSLMCDRSRRQILEMLAAPAEEHHSALIERRSSDIAKALGLAPATVSGHLRRLSDAKLIAFRKDGNEVYYRLENHMLVRAFQDLILALDHEHAARYTNEAS